MLTANPAPEASSFPSLFRHHLERRGTFGDFLKSVFKADTQPPPTVIREGRNLNQPKNGQQIVFNQPIDSSKSGERHPGRCCCYFKKCLGYPYLFISTE